MLLVLLVSCTTTHSNEYVMIATCRSVDFDKQTIIDSNLDDMSLETRAFIENLISISKEGRLNGKYSPILAKYLISGVLDNKPFTIKLAGKYGYYDGQGLFEIGPNDLLKIYAYMNCLNLREEMTIEEKSKYNFYDLSTDDLSKIKTEVKVVNNVVYSDHIKLLINHLYNFKSFTADDFGNLLGKPIKIHKSKKGFVYEYNIIGQYYEGKVMLYFILKDPRVRYVCFSSKVDEDLLK